MGPTLAEGAWHTTRRVRVLLSRNTLSGATDDVSKVCFTRLCIFLLHRNRCLISSYHHRLHFQSPGLLSSIPLHARVLILSISPTFDCHSIRKSTCINIFSSLPMLCCHDV